jgi:osmotically-inducible protein OsmY
MKKQLYKLALVVTLGSGFALAQGMPQQQPQQDKSAVSATQGGDVQGNIQTALQKDPSLANSTISVQVNGKTVELSGTVPTKEAKDAAERIAKENAGEMKVRSSLRVSAKGPGGDNPPRADNPPQPK